MHKDDHKSSLLVIVLDIFSFFFPAACLFSRSHAGDPEPRQRRGAAEETLGESAQRGAIANNNPTPPRFLLTLSDVCISFVFFLIGKV